MKKKMVGKSAIVVVTMSALALASYPAFAAEQNTRTAAMIIWNDVEEITEDELTHMFDRFYTGKNGNTGIGLALARKSSKYTAGTFPSKDASPGAPSLYGGEECCIQR